MSSPPESGISAALLTYEWYITEDWSLYAREKAGTKDKRVKFGCKGKIEEILPYQESVPNISPEVLVICLKITITGRTYALALNKIGRTPGCLKLMPTSFRENFGQPTAEVRKQSVAARLGNNK